MSTAPEGKHIRYDADDFGENRPVDADLAYRVANTILHTCDEHAQVRVNATTYSGKEPLAIATGEFARVAWYGPFPVSLRGDGKSYKLRTRLAMGRSGVPTTANTMTARLCLTPLNTSRFTATELSTGLGTNVLEFTTQAGTTAAWNCSGLLQLDEPLTRAAIRNQETKTTWSGDSVSVRWALCTLEVWAKVADASSGSPRVYGVYAAEYIGTDI